MAERPLTPEESVARFNTESWAAEPESSPMAIYGAPAVSQNPLPGEREAMAGKVFENTAPEQTPFDAVDVEAPESLVAANPNPVTTQVLGAALMGREQPSSPVAAGFSVTRALEQARQAVESGREDLLRSEIALGRSARKRSELRTNVPEFTKSDVYQEGLEYQPQVASDNLTRQLKTAAEREAIDNIQDLAAAGDTVQARILMDRMDPAKANLFAVHNDNLTKQLLISQLASKFRAEDNDEGWMASIYTGLITLFQPTSFSLLGNVDEGIGGFAERNPLTRFFTPGQDLQNQARAIQNMTAEELADYLPELEANIRSNSTYLGVSNPDKLVELIGYFQQPLSDAAATSVSSWANIETGLTYGPGVGVIPYKLGGKALSVPFVMVSAGARKEAANAVATAHETLIKEGKEATLAKTSLTEEEIVDNMMPSSINPEGGGPELSISLQKEINEALAEAEEVLKGWDPRETARFANEEEFAEALQARLDEISGRYGTSVLNHEIVPIKLSDGTTVNRIRVTMGNPKKGGKLFTSRKQAINWRMSVGIGDGAIQFDEGPTRLAHPREEGFTEVVYHGTPHQVQGNLRPSTDGLYGRGVYVTTDPKFADEYSGMSSVLGEATKDTPNIHPLLVNGSKIFGYQGLHRKFTAGEVRGLFKDIGVAVPEKVEGWLLGLGDEVAVFQPTWEIMDEVSYAARHASKDPQAQIMTADNFLADLLEEKGWHGRIGDPGDTLNSLVIFDGKNVRSLFERTVVKDASGGYANVLEFDMPEVQFYTHLDTPEQGATSRFLKNISQTSDEGLYGKGLIADQKAARIFKMIEKDMREAYTPLRKKERMFFDQVVALQSNERRWLTRQEKSALLERAMGRPPREELLHALDRFQVLNDVEYLMRRDGIYRGKVIRGMESVEFKAFGNDVEMDGFYDYNPSKAPKNRAYNISDDIHYVGKKALTDEDMKSLAARGYVKVDLEQPVKLADGTSIQTFIGKRNDILTRPLRRDQLNYVPGGHRDYLSRYQVKQARWIKQPDTGQQSLASPNVFVMAGNIRDARRWANTMDAARIAVKNGEGAAYLDEHVFKGEKGFPTGDEFVEKVESGLIDKDEAFEALYDREMPMAYRKNGVDLEALLGEEGMSGVNSYYRTTGRMYYSGKGDHLKDTYGELAPTINPIQAQAMALYNVTRLSASFGDFKDTAINRWVNKYRPYLNVRDSLSVDEARSAYSIFNKADIADDVDFDLKQQILGQRESIRRILGFQTDLDLNYRHWMRSTAEWVIGDSDNILREKVSNGIYWLYENNPVGFLRGLAFDTKLGMWNIGQWFIQGSTMASALALNPKYGKYGLGSAVSTMAFFLSKGNENVLEQMTKNGMAKLGGFADSAEYKAYMRNAQKSGFFDLGGTHQYVNDYGPEQFASSIRSGVQHVREQGRWFFYNIEVMNRLVAYRIAYGEALEVFGKAAWDEAPFQEFMARRAENYSFNMSNASKSWWQTGLFSLPTQFWAYNVRMIEALTGKNFDTMQKLRLLGMQVAMAGTAGVPVVAGLVDMVKTRYGVEPDIESMGGVLHRGLMDFMMYEMFGADVNIGERWGTGSWSSDLVKDIFGYSEFNTKTWAEISFGATYGIMTSILGPLFGEALPATFQWMTHESGSEEIDMTGEQFMSMFRQIATVNNSLKAYQIYQYGIYTSSKGKVLASDIPSQDAVFAAMGFAPNEMNEMTVMTGYLKNRQESIKDAAAQITMWRQEALNRPDLFEENAKKVNAFVKFLPPDIRRDVLRRAHRDVDPSIYGSIKERFEKTRTREEMLQNVEEGME